MGSRTPQCSNGALLKAIAISLSTDAVSEAITLGDVDTFEVENDETSAGVLYLITADADPDVAGEIYPIQPGTSRMIVANNPTIRVRREAGLAVTGRIWRTGQPPTGA